MTSRNPGGDKSAADFQVVKRPARDRIFETAKDMFYERGIRAVGVESIAAEADATKMTLYRNFPSKDGLVAEVMRQQVRDANAWWDEVIASLPADPRARLEGFFDAFEAKACACSEAIYGCALANAAIELHDKDHPAQQVSVEYKRENLRRLRALAQEAGAPDSLGDGLMLLMEGAYAARVTLAADAQQISVAKAAKGLIAAYLGAARPTV